MNHSEPADQEFQELLHQLREGALSAEQAERLYAGVVADAEKRRLYLDHAQLLTLLRWSHEAGGSEPAEVAAAAPPPPRTPRTPWPVVAAPVETGRRWQFTGATLFAGMMVLVIWSGFLFTLFNLLGSSRTPPPAAEANLEAAPCATLAALHDCVWNGPPPGEVGSRLPNGMLHLRRGRLEVRFDDGASVVVEGPADFAVRGADRSYLGRGTLRAVVPPKAQGFTVATSSAVIVDVGTEFGVSVSQDQTTEIEVLAGQVVVHQSEGAQTSLAGTLLVPGQALRTKLGGHAQWIAAEPQRFAHLVSPVPSAPPKTEHRAAWRDDPDLIGLYSADEASRAERRLVNQARFAERRLGDGMLLDGVQAGDPRQGRGPWWIFTRARGATGLTPVFGFDGEDDHIDFPITDFGKQFTFSVWLYPHYTGQRGVIFGNMRSITRETGFSFSVEEYDPTPPMPHAEAGRLVLVADNGAKRVRLVKTEPGVLKYDQWQHLALVVDAEAGTARIYRNGVAVGAAEIESSRVYRDDLPVHDPEMELTVPGLRTRGIWTLGANLQSTNAFAGMMDEAAIFRRALGEAEIAELARRTEE